jgi:dTMP kinase
MAWFITIEGGDGSGKSTLLKHIEATFKTNNIAYLCTREPGGTPVAEEIRNTLLKPGRALDPMAELFLYEAARAEHVSGVIRPALKQGKHVLCDRFTHSSLAYQGAARGLGEQLVNTLNDAATGGLKPDAVLWLKLDPETAKQRAAKRGDQNRLDSEKEEFHQKVFNAFEKMAKLDHKKFIVLDASQSPDDIFKQLLNHPRWKELMA